MYAKKEKWRALCSVVLVVLLFQNNINDDAVKSLHNKYNKLVLGNAAQKIEVNK